VSDLHGAGGADAEVTLDVRPVSYHDSAGWGICGRPDCLEAAMRPNEDGIANLYVPRPGDDVGRPRHVAAISKTGEPGPEPEASSAAAGRPRKRTEGSHGVGNHRRWVLPPLSSVDRGRCAPAPWPLTLAEWCSAFVSRRPLK
jgi:hypothetical protein